MNLGVRYMKMKAGSLKNGANATKCLMDRPT